MSSDIVEVYPDKHHKWRWRYRAANGRILADSGQGYARRGDAIKGYRLVTRGAPIDIRVVTSCH